MKTIFSFLLLFCLFTSLVAQETIKGQITHGAVERSYILYVPEIYNEGKAVPLVLNFHGYTSNANQQMKYGDFRPIADTANFIIVHPQGTLLDGKTHFNVGGWTLKSKADDVGFTKALIKEISSKYNIDQSRIYSTGMSNGGYMSFVLACQLSDQIAAVASVTGSMTPQTFRSCDPTHPTPILQIHGTLDPTVPYEGSELWTKSINDVLAFWTKENGCSVEPDHLNMKDSNLEDGTTVSQTIYNDCNQLTKVVHYKVDKGTHQWPGSKINRPGTNQDFNASLEIWKFFSQFDLDDLQASDN